MDLLEGDAELTEFEVIDAQSVKGVRQGANGFPFLMMKGLGDGEAVKDWASWDADHGASGKGGAAGDSKASAASAVARAKQTIADHKAGKKVSAADLKNAHDVHEAHLAHEAKLKADAKPAAKKDVAKGQRDCPKCDKSYDADHEGGKCENCGTDLPDAPVAKAADDNVDCPTCKGDGKIMGGKRDCPDCDASGSVTPAKAKTLTAKSLVQGIIAKAVGAGGQVDEQPDIAGGTAVLAQIADLIISEATELKAGQAGEIADILQLACAAEAIWCWRTGEEAVSTGSVMPATALMQSAADAGDDTTKGEIAKAGTDVDTVTQTGGLTKAVEEAIAKATAPLQERVTALDAELAKVKATPVPGGPVLSRNVQVKVPGAVVSEDTAAKAALMRQKAAEATAPSDREGYLAYARELDEQARTKSA